MKISRIPVGLLAVALWISHPFSWAAAPEAVYGEKGMVASRNTMASQVGADVMAKGGNAVDAIVATAFALAVTHPSAGNLGGGGFAVIRLPSGEVITNDHRETAPAGASRDMYLDADGNVIKGKSLTTHLASGVPGSVAGLLDIHEKYGELSRKDVMKPAIQLAKKGFLLSFDLARQFREKADLFAPHPASVAKFKRADGSAYEPGDKWKQPDLARTLKAISKLGRDGFYAGQTAELVVAEMQRGGGLITAEDLAAYKSAWRAPVMGTYRGYEIYSMPPPSSGGIMVIQMLNMLEGQRVAQLGWGSADLAHLMIEAQRRVFADRAVHFGDPDFYDVPVAQMLDKEYARQRFSTVSHARASRSSAIQAGPLVADESPQTTHFSAMDAEGWAVALTTTLNRSYGSGIVVTDAGFLLNNEMDDFSSKPGVYNSYGALGDEANAIAPRKRMLSSMTPTLVVRDGDTILATGSPGGTTIINTVLQVLINVLDHNMTLSQAVAAPRFHHQWMPDRIIHEPFAFSPDTLTLLEGKGHRAFRSLNAPGYLRGLGCADSVMWGKVGDRLMFQGVSDPRGDGGAAGL